MCTFTCLCIRKVTIKNDSFKRAPLITGIETGLSGTRGEQAGSELYMYSGGSRKLERGVQRGQLNRRGFTTAINYNVCLLTSIRALLLADVSLVHFVVH